MIEVVPEVNREAIGRGDITAEIQGRIPPLLVEYITFRFILQHYVSRRSSSFSKSSKSGSSSSSNSGSTSTKEPGHYDYSIGNSIRNYEVRVQSTFKSDS